MIKKRQYHIWQVTSYYGVIELRFRLLVRESFLVSVLQL